jgi:hypothetical protein
VAKVNKQGKRPHGRPTKLTPEVTEAICQAIRIGTPQKYAAEGNGIAEDTLLGWMRRGAAAEEPYDKFFEAVTRARADCVKRLVINSQGDGPSGARWLLERRYPSEFGNRTKIEHSGPDGGPIATRDVTQMTDEELKRFVAGDSDA